MNTSKKHFQQLVLQQISELLTTEANANTQQLQNTQQHEHLRQAFSTTSPAANRVAPSNETTASSKFHSILCD